MLKSLTLIVILSLSAYACLPAAIVYTGYAISSSNDEAAQKEADAKNLQTYNSYKDNKDKLNLDREKAQMKPIPVMTFAEWKLAHNIPTRVSD